MISIVKRAILYRSRVMISHWIEEKVYTALSRDIYNKRLRYPLVYLSYPILKTL